MKIISLTLFRLTLTCLALSLVFQLEAQTPSAPSKLQWISTTSEKPWQELPTNALPKVKTDKTEVLTVDPTIEHQEIIGFGGCFNELAWKALRPLQGTPRAEVFQALFGPTGCNFIACREGIGANDFALAWYSLDETPDDYNMDHFNIDEDSKTLIPFIKEAAQYQPKLAIWGVPWCPPSWMKTNGKYKGGFMKQDPKTLSAYALYFSKYVQAYRQQGINIRAVMPQNEPVYNNNVYPQCVWKGTEINTFLRDYLVPQLKKDQVAVEVWLGTIPKGKMADFADPVFQDPVTGPEITGVGYQYSGQKLMLATHQAYPDKLILQTETECYHGKNLWVEGLGTFNHLIEDTNNYSNGYMFWNMILDEKSSSSWGWQQNSLIKIDSQTGQVTYNPEFYAMKHFGNLVLPGAKEIQVSGPTSLKATALKNPSGQLVINFSNTTKNPVTTYLQVGTSGVQLEVPAQSMNSVVWTP